MARSLPKALDPIFAGLIIGLTVFGLIILLSASGPISFQHYSDPLYFLRRQMSLGLLPGVLAFFLVSRFDYRLLKPYAFPALIVSIGLLLSVFIPGLGHTVGGATSWLNFGFFRLQPSELVKVTFLVYSAGWLTTYGKKEGLTVQGAMPFLIAIGAVMTLLMLQPDTGTMSVIILTALVLYFVAGAPIQWFVVIAGALAILIGLLITIAPYRADRFLTFLHPELDPQGIGYHINQAFLAIGSGGIFGLGYGQSRQKYLYLPEVQGDSIFAVMAEEMGFVVCLLFLSAVALLIWKIFEMARAAGDDFGKYLCIGVGGWIAVQTLVNVASMTGLMPMTGVTLPFVSYGNSATVSLFIGLGLVASVYRHTRTSV